MNKYWFLLASVLIFVVGCGARVSPTFSAAIATPTPQSRAQTIFSVPALPAQKKLLGAKALQIPPLLNGRLFWVSSFNTNRPDEVTRSVRVFQVLDFAHQRLSRIESFDLTSIAQPGSQLGWPTYWRENKCFIRSSHSLNDTSSCSLYEIDFTKQQAVNVKGSFYGMMRFLISPNRNYYAYYTSDPYNRAYYRLNVVDQDGNSKVISRDIASDTFTWTPRNTLIYFYVKQEQIQGIVEDDLKGHLKVIQKTGEKPVMSPSGRYLATFVAHAPNGKKLPTWEEYNNGSKNPEDYIALSVYDLKIKKQHIVAQISPDTTSSNHNPQVIWSQDGLKFFMMESFYYEDKKTTLCRVSEYDVATQKYRRLAELKHRNPEADPDEWQPTFRTLKLANNRYLLFNANLRKQGKDNWQIVALDVKTGKNYNWFSFSSDQAGLTYYGVPEVDWVDAKSQS